MLELLEGKRIVICAGSGGVGKTTTAAALALGMAERGLRVAVVTIDPAQAARRLARARGARQRAAARRPRAARRARHRVQGELWAMMLDAKRTFDALIERLAPDDGDARRGVREPDLPAALQRGRRLAGVHGDREALRARPGGRLRPARARHAAVAQRARLPRRAAAPEGLLRRPRDPDVPAPGRAQRQGARPRHGRRVRPAQAASPASTCCRTCRCSSARSAA